MGMRFRKSKKIAPGVRLNLSALNGANLNPVYFFKKVFAVVVKFSRK